MKNRILLVDDESGICKVLGISLADAGYQVDTAENGEQALEMFERVSPRIVITDIKMPGMDGIELLRRIKQHSPETGAEYRLFTFSFYLLEETFYYENRGKHAYKNSQCPGKRPRPQSANCGNPLELQ